MKFSPSHLLFFAATAFAQVGMLQSTSGIHVPSAQTNEKGILFVSGSYSMVSDGNPLGIGGFYTDDEGNETHLRSNTPSNDEKLFVSFSPLDRVELGIGVPVHYDGDIENTDLKGFALGDLELSAKWYFNAMENLYFGLSGEILFPTGSKEKGFRPRHTWFIGKENNGYAYTAGSVVLNANMHLTLELNKLMMATGYIGALSAYNEELNYILWGGGINVRPFQVLTFIFEISGETPFLMHRVASNIVENTLRFTPAVRLNLPKNTFLTISGDVGINYFFNPEDKYGKTVQLKSSKKDLRFRTAGTPDISVAVSVSKMFDISWSDKDGDGVIDRNDLCPNTAPGMAVNSRGCPVDEDQDGVLNIVDLCLGTMRGLEVDYNGCPLDLDNDGVYDYQDKCLNTPAGYSVDEFGCPKDSDNDGINDNFDKCPNSKPGELIDGEGCPLDQDQDGIPNDIDQCPNTPENVPIDNFGCPLDQDKDGVPDNLDRCPDSAPGEKVNQEGCPSDEDSDGIPDVMDKCPNTPKEVKVNEFGCRVDSDGDGIYDEEDFCPETPEKAPVDEKGCPMDTDKDGIPDWMDQCEGSLPNVKTDDVGCPVNSRLNFNDIAKRIRFKSKTTILLNSSYTALNDIVAFMRQYPILLKIQSIVDDDFDDTYKLAIGRMSAVLDYLTGKGIPKERIYVQEDIERNPDTEKKGKTGVIGLTPMIMQE